jgi:uncharacterized protein
MLRESFCMQRMLKLFLAVVLLGCLGQGSGQGSVEKLPMGNATLELPDGAIINCEVPLTAKGAEVGLMYRDGLCEHCGMLFMFKEEGKIAFWMKNMKIPIDIIFLNKDWEAVGIFRDVPPCAADPCTTYSPESNAKYVLELKANSSQVHRIENGSAIKRTA